MTHVDVIGCYFLKVYKLTFFLAGVVAATHDDDDQFSEMDEADIPEELIHLLAATHGE